MNLGVGEILMIFFVLVMVALITAMVAGAGITVARRVGKPQTPGLSAREVIELRYARGEISREQFETLKRDLLGRG